MEYIVGRLLPVNIVQVKAFRIALDRLLQRRAQRNQVVDCLVRFLQAVELNILQLLNMDNGHIEQNLH